MAEIGFGEGFTLLVCLTVLLAACRPTNTEVEGRTLFRSDAHHLQVTLPPEWAATEGPEHLARPFTGLVAFNSWGEPDFWAPAVTMPDSTTHRPASVLGQIPDEGAYVVLVHISGGPCLLAEQYGPEHEQQDLGGLWAPQDCRQGEFAPGATYINFFKWRRALRLEVYCGQNASDATVTAVNDLLATWRFDAVPIGDTVWATVEARKEEGSTVLPGTTSVEESP